MQYSAVVYVTRNSSIVNSVCMCVFVWMKNENAARTPQQKNTRNGRATDVKMATATKLSKKAAEPKMMIIGWGPM